MTDLARIVIHREDGRWWADSPDVPGWFAAADHILELQHLIKEASEFVPFGPYIMCQGWLPTRAQASSLSGVSA